MNIDKIKRNGTVVASFRASDDEQVMLVTDQAKLIRMKVADMRVIGRNSSGVKLFDVAKGEHVVGAAKIDEEEEPENEAEDAVVEEMVEQGISDGDVAIPDEPEAPDDTTE